MLLICFLLHDAGSPGGDTLKNWNRLVVAGREHWILEWFSEAYTEHDYQYGRGGLVMLWGKKSLLFLYQWCAYVWIIIRRIVEKDIDCQTA